MKQKGYSVLIFLLSIVICLGCNVTPGSEGASPGSLPDTTMTSSQEWPPDIDPDSRSRLPLKKREDLDEEGKEVYDFLVDPENQTLAGLTGPRGFYLYSPKAGQHLSQANTYLRFESGLDPQVRELAILVIAREMRSQFEWTMHEPVAREVGLEPAAIEVVRDNKSPQNLTERNALIIRFGRELVREPKLSSETFSQVAQAFGEEELVTLTLLMGNYMRTALLLRAVNMQLPLDREPLLPIAE
jgi:4-carboxymuconolactone decarboxylase